MPRTALIGCSTFRGSTTGGQTRLRDSAPTRAPATAVHVHGLSEDGYAGDVIGADGTRSDCLLARLGESRHAKQNSVIKKDGLDPSTVKYKNKHLLHQLSSGCFLLSVGCGLSASPLTAVSRSKRTALIAVGLVRNVEEATNDSEPSVIRRASSIVPALRNRNTRERAHDDFRPCTWRSRCSFPQDIDPHGSLRASAVRVLQRWLLPGPDHSWHHEGREYGRRGRNGGRIAGRSRLGIAGRRAASGEVSGPSTRLRRRTFECVRMLWSHSSTRGIPGLARDAICRAY